MERREDGAAPGTQDAAAAQPARCWSRTPRARQAEQSCHTAPSWLPRKKSPDCCPDPKFVPGLSSPSRNQNHQLLQEPLPKPSRQRGATAPPQDSPALHAERFPQVRSWKAATPSQSVRVHHPELKGLVPGHWALRKAASTALLDASKGQKADSTVLKEELLDAGVVATENACPHPCRAPAANIWGVRGRG